MIPRGVLDIDWPTLFNAALCSFASSADVQEVCTSVERVWDVERRVVVSQSVRSGLDAVLSAMGWPVGSEILLSAVTIPEMARIVEEHGLVPVPVDVHPESLAPDFDQLQARITPRTRAILVAHLFGSRLDLGEIGQIAQLRGVALWEDVAQGFAADGFPGDSQADISFFSFGMIKAQTALGGAILRFVDSELATKCRTVQSQWPLQATSTFRRKLYRSMLLRLLSGHAVFTVAAGGASCAGLDIDAWLSRSARGFDPAAFFEQLRQRPCGALVELLQRRLVRRDRRWLARKNEMAEHYCRLLPPHVLPGREAFFPSRWVLPVLSRDPQKLRMRLVREGYDATIRASQLRVVPAREAYPEWTTPLAQDWVSRLVFLPLHPSLRRRHIAAIAATVNDVELEERETARKG